MLPCDSEPGAAGLRGFPVLPQSRQISLYCSSPQRSSWQPESYPGWGKTEEQWMGLTLQSTKRLYHLTRHGQDMLLQLSNTQYLLALAPPELSLVTCSMLLQSVRYPEIPEHFSAWSRLTMQIYISHTEAAIEILMLKSASYSLQKWTVTGGFCHFSATMAIFTFMK